MKQFEIPEKLFVTHSEDADKAFSRAVRQELLKRKKLGLSASAWRDGKVVIVPPEEIPVEDEPIQRQSRKHVRNAGDLGKIDQNAERINEEALDTLNYQVDLLNSEVKDEE